MARTLEMKRVYKELFQQLSEIAIHEHILILNDNMEQLYNWTEDYLWLKNRLDELRTANPDRTFRIGVKLENHKKMSIFNDLNYPLDPKTCMSSRNENRRNLEQSMRKRLHEYSSSKETKFSSIED